MQFFLSCRFCRKRGRGGGEEGEEDEELLYSLETWGRGRRGSGKRWRSLILHSASPPSEEKRGRKEKK